MSLGNYGDFVKRAAMGGAAGFIGDAFTEVSDLPYLNDQAPVGGAQMSNFEMITYGVGGIMTTLGLIDLISGTKFGGIGRDLLPTGLGIIFGTNLYENHGSQFLGIRAPAK